MSAAEETIQATLGPNGQVRLARQPQLPAGSVSVTIRGSTPTDSRRGLADVIRELAAEQRSRGFSGRSEEELQAEEDSRSAEEAGRDRELDAARRFEGT